MASNYYLAFFVKENDESKLMAIENNFGKYSEFKILFQIKMVNIETFHWFRIICICKWVRFEVVSYSWSARIEC